MAKSILYYDCFAGISGDMNLGALIDAGVDVSFLREELEKLGVGGYELKTRTDARQGISGTKVDVELTNPQEHHHRKLDDIRGIIQSSTLSERVKSCSLDIFTRLAEAEAKIHGTGVSQVHFHEVGAVDAIVDIVGAALCLEYLKIDRVLASPVELGSGYVKCAHGTLPVPAPATLALLSGKPVKTGNMPFEATTPTGAAILVSIAEEFTPSVELRVDRVGYGVGSRQAAEKPNVLRVVLGEELGTENDAMHQEAVMVECNIDDMSPEAYEYLMERLFAAGASDVFLTSIVMKKSRPAVKLSVLCTVDTLPAVKELVLTDTPTLGIRRTRVEKDMLRRDFDTVSTRYGKVRIKRAYYRGKQIKSKPEYEDCRKLAAKWGVSLKEIYDSIPPAEA